MRRFYGVLALLILVVGCAKEKAYQGDDAKGVELAEGKLTLKQNVMFCTEDDPCLWVPSVDKTPKEVTASRPFWLGEQKLVVTRLTEGKLQILEMKVDPLFRDNQNNFSPVAEFEVEHVDFQCKRDDYDKCTNKEEEADDLAWHQKKFLRFKDFKILEKNTLPIQFSELFQKSCFTEVGKDHLVNLSQGQKYVNIEPGQAMNKAMRVHYQANLGCVQVRELSDLSNLSFSVDYRYSIVKLSSVSDPNYQAIAYPQQDQGRFGFFKSEIIQKTVDARGDLIGVKKHLVNRFSPNKRSVVYYLTKDFYRPQYKKILEATEKSVEHMNTIFAHNGIPLNVELKNGTGMNVGDIRKSFIILEDEDQASGLIGYGPSVKNPITGEIISARTVMYLGTMKKFFYRTWDELVEAHYATPAAVEVQAEETTESEVTEAEEEVETQGFVAGSTLSLGQSKQLASQLTDLTLSDLHANLNYVLERDQRSLDLFEEQMVSAQEQLFATNMHTNFNKHMKELNKEKHVLDSLAKNNFFHASMIDFYGMGKEIIAKLQQEHPEIQILPWDRLSEEHRQIILDELLPVAWTPTFVHELGHNFGLRHNFEGSVDKENFYTEAENHQHGLKRASAYSSIMDYGYHTLNELVNYGKYDIAALKFAYSRKVDMKDGSTASLGTSSLKDYLEANAGSQIKPYMYCTDENVGNTSLCNRHDEGTSAKEIVQHYIDQYYENYEKINLRNRRYDFNSIYGDVDYYIRTVNHFINIRTFFDEYDQMRSFRGGIGDATERMKDFKEASDLAFKFFVDVLKTPTYHCIKVDASSGSIVDIAPFEKMVQDHPLSQFGIRFDVQLGCVLLEAYQEESGKYQYYEFGKHLNNTLNILERRETSNRISQIGVRGIWMDKVWASFFLSYRMRGASAISTTSSSNFFDYPEYQSELLQTSYGILSDSVSLKDIPVRRIDPATGRVSQVTLGGYTMEFNSNHIINKSYNSILSYFMGLREKRTNFKEIFLSRFKTNFRAKPEEMSADETLFNFFDAHRFNTQMPLEEIKRRYGVTVEEGSLIEFKNAQGLVDLRIAAYDYNIVAKSLIAQKNEIDVALAKLGLDGINDEAEQKLLGEVLVIFLAGNAEQARTLIDFSKAPKEVKDQVLKILNLSKEEVQKSLQLAQSSERVLKAIKSSLIALSR